MATNQAEVTLYRKYIELLKLLNIYLNHFPNHEKYGLSQSIRITAYELFDLITEGQKKYYKKTTLTNLDVKHEQLRMKIYLANELDYFHFKDGKKVSKTANDRYLSISKMIDEVGKLIGGWINQLKNEDKFK